MRGGEWGKVDGNGQGCSPLLGRVRYTIVGGYFFRFLGFCAIWQVFLLPLIFSEYFFPFY